MEQKRSLAVTLKEFFGYESLAAFRSEWERLTQEDKDYFRVELAKVGIETA